MELPDSRFLVAIGNVQYVCRYTFIQHNALFEIVATTTAGQESLMMLNLLPQIQSRKNKTAGQAFSRQVLFPKMSLQDCHHFVNGFFVPVQRHVSIPNFEVGLNSLATCTPGGDNTI